MPAPEYADMKITGLPKPEEEAHSNDVPEYRSVSSADYRSTALRQQEESPMEIMERFIGQDRELEGEPELFEHLKPAVEYTEQPTTNLIEKQELVRILEDARNKGIPHSLLESLWDLRNCHPEDVKEPPRVREHALSDVIRPMCEQGLEHELKNDLLFDLEGEEAMEKLCVPQPQSEIDNPQNLYQLVRKAWDQNRMEELLGMIEENDDALLGETLEEAVARHRRIGTELQREDA